MIPQKGIVLDANILLRAVFGTRVPQLLDTYHETVAFYTPDRCIDEAKRNIPAIAQHRNLDPPQSIDDLNRIVLTFIDVVDRSLYEEFEERARARIASRDADDWPVVATALLIDAPIWTEDRDFFGSGIATWTSGSVELYLREA
jgi:predicted nucleic acid-binding protein